MTTTPHVEAVPAIDAAVERRSIKVASRLMLGANVSIQLSFLFGYLYLRANNFDQGWRLNGAGSPPMGLTVAVLLVQVLALLAVWLALGQADLSGLRALAVPALAVGLLVGLVDIGLRIFLLTHFGATVDQGAYVDISILWYGAIAALVTIGCLWLIKVLAGQSRGTAPASAADVRAVAEYWLLITITAIGVFLLVQFVT